MLQTADEPPAFIEVKTSGWRTGSKDVLEKLSSPQTADTVNPNTYKFRITIQMETGDERYGFVNTCLWVGSGCRRSNEGKLSYALDEILKPQTNNLSTVIYDAYRVT